jgi:Ser/Thr protein kinase RdoA (MazF antagonist)
MAEVPDYQLDSLFKSTGKLYGLGDVRGFKSAGGIANQNYIVEFSEGGFFVKLIANGDSRDIADLTAIVNRIALSGFETPPLITRLDGSSFYDAGRCIVVVQPFVKGEPNNSLDAVALGQVGDTLGRLHLVKIDGLPIRETWWSESYLHNQFNVVKKNGFTDIMKSLDKRMTRLDSDADLPNSIVHGDPWSGNFLFYDNRLVWLVDWDEVTIAPSIYDLVYTAVTCCFGESKLNLKYLNALVSAYNQQRQLESAEMSSFSCIANRIICINSLWLLQKATAPNADPELRETVNWLMGLDLSSLENYGF